MWIESIILINFKDVSNLDYIMNLTKFKLVNELKLVNWLYPPRYVSNIFKSSKINEMHTITIRGNAFAAVQPEVLSRFLN